MKEKYTISKQYMLVGLEEKGKVDLYTLLELPAHHRKVLVAIGEKSEGLTIGQTVEATLEITIENESFDLKEGRKFVEVARKFIRSVKPVSEK